MTIDQLDTLLTALGKVFADDTKLISKIADLVARCLLQEDLFNVIQWALQNNMQLNETKFEVINYKLNKSLLLRELPFSNEDYSLTNRDCSWTPHIHQMLKTAKKMAPWVFSVFSDRSPFLMLTLSKTNKSVRSPEFHNKLLNKLHNHHCNSPERISNLGSDAG